MSYLKQIITDDDGKRRVKSTIALTDKFDLGKGHGSILPGTPGGWMLHCNHGIRFCGAKFGSGKTRIHDESLIELDTGECYLFFDEDEELTRRKTAELKLSVPEKVRDQLSKQEQVKLRIEMQKVISEAPKDMEGFAKFFNAYILATYHFDRGIFYVISERTVNRVYRRGEKSIKRKVCKTSLQSLSSRTVNADIVKYVPPKSIARDVLNGGGDAIIRYPDEEEDVSLSIVERKIQTVICYPCYARGGLKPVSIYYVDSLNVIKRLDVEKVCFLCSLLGSQVDRLLKKKSVATDEESELKTPVPPLKQLKFRDEDEID